MSKMKILCEGVGEILATKAIWSPRLHPWQALNVKLYNFFSVTLMSDVEHTEHYLYKCRCVDPCSVLKKYLKDQKMEEGGIVRGEVSLWGRVSGVVMGRRCGSMFLHWARPLIIGQNLRHIPVPWGEVTDAAASAFRLRTRRKRKERVNIRTCTASSDGLRSSRWNSVYIFQQRSVVVLPGLRSWWCGWRSRGRPASREQ